MRSGTMFNSELRSKACPTTKILRQQGVFSMEDPRGSEIRHYRLPGGELSLELLLTLPESLGESPRLQELRDRMKRFTIVERARARHGGIRAHTKNSEARRQTGAARVSAIQVSSLGRTQHTRACRIRRPRKGAGLSASCIAEVQSDWHQAGRRGATRPQVKRSYGKFWRRAVRPGRFPNAHGGIECNDRAMMTERFWAQDGGQLRA